MLFARRIGITSVKMQAFPFQLFAFELRNLGTVGVIKFAIYGHCLRLEVVSKEQF